MSIRVKRYTLLNFKRIVEAEFDLTEPMTRLTGLNGHGKSSSLDGLCWALAGKRLCPEQPVRAGAEYAEGTAEIIGEPALLITRRAYPDGRQTVSVRSADGKVKYDSPEGMLKKLFGDISYGLLEFCEEQPKEQAKLLAKAAGIDLDDYEGRRKAAYEDRTNAGKWAREAQARANVLPSHAGVPDSPVDVSALMDQMAEARKINDEADKLQRSALTAAMDFETAKAKVARSAEKSAKLQAEIDKSGTENQTRTKTADDAVDEADAAEKAADEAEEAARRLRARATHLRQKAIASVSRVHEWESLEKRMQQDFEEATREHAEWSEKLAAFEPEFRDRETAAASATRIDIAEIEAKVRAAEATNAKVRDNVNSQKAKDEAKKAVEKHELADETYKMLERNFSERIAAAKIPVPGLTFDIGGVKLNGVPFSQASTAEKLRTSLAVGLALKPGLKLFIIKEGSMLDEHGMKALAAMAAEAEAQILIERVYHEDEPGILISEGLIVGNRLVEVKNTEPLAIEASGG